MDPGPAQLLGADLLAGGRLHQRRAAQEDGAGAVDDDGLVAHGRHVGAAGGAAAHDRGQLGDPAGGEDGLVVEDPAEMLPVREHLGLQGQEGAAAVHQVEAGQPVLQGDLLGAQVLFHREREVGAALDRGVVGHHHAPAPVHQADAGDQPGGGQRVGVDVQGREQPHLQERRPRVAQGGDPVPDEQLALLGVPGPAGPARLELGLARPQVLAQGQVMGMVLPEGGRGRLDLAPDEGHGRDSWMMWRAMTIRWISLVPSPMVQSLASR